MESEVARLRSELRVNVGAYNKLQKERDNLFKELSIAHDKITKLNEDLEMRDRLFAEYRENKEKQYKELLMMKRDLEIRLQSALEFDDTNVEQKRLSLSIGRNQAWWSDNYSSELSCIEAVDILRKWDGMENTISLFTEFIKDENERFQWKPGTVWNSKWKPHLVLYISGAQHIPSQLNKRLMSEFEGVCRAGGTTLSTVSVSFNDSHLDENIVIDLCLQEVSKCDIFLCVLHFDCDILTKLQVEHGFLNNPTSRPSIFIFIESANESNNLLKLKNRVKKMSDRTKIIESKSLSDEVLQLLINEIKTICKSNFDITDTSDNDQDKMFTHLSLLSDMRTEYEQTYALEMLLTNSPEKPAGIDVTFQYLTAYMNEEQSSVAPYLITGPTGAGKSTLLAQWYQYIQQNHKNKIEVLYHFVLQSCSSSSETSLMYRRFIFKLMQICGGVNITVPVNSNELEDVFVHLLEVTSARLKSLDRDLVFILIDNTEQLVELTNFGWIMKPLPQYIRVILTANDSGNYPDSWKSLPTNTFPSPTATDLQQVISGVKYGIHNKMLSVDEVLSLTYSTPTDPSNLWCVIAAKYILSKVSDDLDIDELTECLSEIEDVSELAKLSVDEFISENDILSNEVDQILQLIYWSRNGLYYTELKKMIDISDTTLLFLISELQKRHILHEVAGLIQFANESVQHLVDIKYDTDIQNMSYWSHILISLFSDISNQTLARCTSELLWLLKRAEMKTDLINALLNVDILIQLYCGGESALLLRFWKYLDVSSDKVAEEYYKELALMEEQAANDQSSLLYIAMVFCTVGKILCNLGLAFESQPLIQRSLELYECHCEPDSSDVASSMYELANLYANIDRYNAAESFYKQSLEVYEHVHGEDSKETLKVLSALSTLYEEMKRPDLLDAITTRLYSLKEQTKPNALSILKNRADELEDFLTSFEDSRIPTQSDILALNEWSVLHASFGDKSIAEDYLFTALNSSEEILGNDHNITQIIIKNLITLYQQSEKFEEVVPLQRRLIELKENEHGLFHTSVAAASNNLAKDYETALNYYGRAIEIYEKLYSPDHEIVQDTIRNRDFAAEEWQSINH